MSNIFDQYDSHVQNGRWDDACKIASELTRIAPDKPNTWFNLGVCLEQTDQPFKAATAFQRCLLIDPSDERVVFRMLRSMLLANRHDALFEELRTYAYENPELLHAIADLDTFSKLFQSDSKYASLLTSAPTESVSASTRRENLESIHQLGFDLPSPLPPGRSVACSGFLRFTPEVGLRALALRSLNAFLTEDVSTAKINDCINHVSAQHYLRQDEHAIIAMARDDARNHYGHLSGWFMERLLPLAWILGFPHLPPPDGDPLSDESMSQISEFIGEIDVFDNVWDWLGRFSQPRSQGQIVDREDLYYLAQIAVQQSRSGHTDGIPANFDPVFHGGVVLERWGSLFWALTPELPLTVDLF